MKVSNICHLIAIEAHRGQKRRDGITGYISHPEAVEARCRDVVQKCLYFYNNSYKPEVILDVEYPLYLLVKEAAYVSQLSQEDLIEAISSVCFLHDVVEDAGENFGYWYIHKILKEKNVPQHVIKAILDAIEAITKLDKHKNSYLDYILIVKNNPISRLVKIADISHNLESQPKEKNIDKYNLARYILLH